MTPTFVIVEGIECGLCGKTSFNQNDVANRYCGNCHMFHDAVMQARELFARGATHECAEWRLPNRRCAVCNDIVVP